MKANGSRYLLHILNEIRTLLLKYIYSVPDDKFSFTNFKIILAPLSEVMSEDWSE